MSNYTLRCQIIVAFLISGSISASVATAQSSLDFILSQVTTGGRSFDAKLADLDGDDDLDIVFGNAAAQPNEVWLNDGTGFFSDSGQRLGLNSTFVISLGDLDGDGDIDMFAANCWTNNDNHVWINQGGDQSGTPGQFLDSGQRLGGRNSANVHLGDVDGDNDLDAIVTNVSDAFVLWINDSSGNFTEVLLASDTDRIRGARFLDVDGDDDLDIICEDLAIWKNDGQGVFTVHPSGLSDQYARNSYYSDQPVGDIDGDDDPDTLILSADRRHLFPVLNDGSGTFTVSEDTYSFGQQLTIGAMADLDTDGDLDLLVNFENGGKQILLNDGAGVFSDSGVEVGTAGSTGLGPIRSLRLAVGDLDANGQPDLVFPYVKYFQNDHVSAPNSIWINSSGSTCSSADIDGDNIVGSVDLARLLGAWNSSDLSADINGDGHVGPIDLAMLLGAWGVCP